MIPSKLIVDTLQIGKTLNFIIIPVEDYFSIHMVVKDKEGIKKKIN